MVRGLDIPLMMIIIMIMVMMMLLMTMRTIFDEDHDHNDWHEEEGNSNVTQVAEGDVVRGLEIPLYLVFPRYKFYPHSPHNPCYNSLSSPPGPAR